MDQAVQQALAHDTLIDITTTGRKTGRQYRKELAFHVTDGRLYLTGRPGRRGWYANMLANPDFIIHLKQSLKRDVPGKATPITDKARRRALFQRMKALETRLASWNVDDMVERSPLVEVDLGSS